VHVELDDAAPKGRAGSWLTNPIIGCCPAACEGSFSIVVGTKITAGAETS
jgi:hypothetical protein